jgi:hypothetical protein
MMTLDSQVLIPADVLFQEVQGETVLLDLRSESYFGLDPVGAGIWRSLVQDRPLRQIVAELEQEYDATPERLSADLLALLESLVEAGLIEICHAT